jgi:hypothetical protein
MRGAFTKQGEAAIRVPDKNKEDQKKYGKIFPAPISDRGGCLSGCVLGRAGFAPIPAGIAPQSAGGSKSSARPAKSRLLRGRHRWIPWSKYGDRNREIPSRS